jgi:5-methylcytosine-specific restriction endonuclease McrBC regulatory subunit McrC
MLRRLKKVKEYKANDANLLKKDYPILEIFITLFLDELDTLIKQ